jgi:hypothetical protein
MGLSIFVEPALLLGIAFMCCSSRPSRASETGAGGKLASAIAVVFVLVLAVAAASSSAQAQTPTPTPDANAVTDTQPDTNGH